MKQPEPEQAHRWLHQLVGEWTFQSDSEENCRGTERVRKLGELWVVGESVMKMPDVEAHSMITIGYDPERKRFVGSWVGSMMTKLWVYDGELDAAGRFLALYSEGPAFDENCNFVEGKTSRYRDAIEILDDNTRLFTGSAQAEDGTWKQFMSLRHRRVG